MEEISCIVCDHAVKVTIENLVGYQEGQDFKISHCLACDTSFAWPHLVEDRIYDYIYSQMKIVPGYNRYAIYAEEVVNCETPLDYLANKEANYFAIREIVTKNRDKTIKILEVGSGLGYLTYAIKQQGYNIIGLDISSDAIRKAKRQFGDYYVCSDVYSFSSNNPGEFDMVIITEVIEHVSDPKTFCKMLVNLLKVGGKLVATTPNKSAFPREENWATELPPIHLTWFSETSFKSIARQLNLTLSFFDYSAFNKKHVDVSRVRFYKIFYKKEIPVSVLDKMGKVISPITRSTDNVLTKLKSIFKHLIKPIFILLLTNKKNLSRNSMLCVILQKNS